MRFTPTANWSLAVNSPSKLITWKIYLRKVTTLTESLTSGTTFTDVTEYIAELPSYSQAIEYGIGQFTSDSFSLNGNNINYWQIEWIEATEQIEVKIICNIGVSSSVMSSDNAIIATGFIDKTSFKLDEAADTCNFLVQSYDEYTNRIDARQILSTNTSIVNGVTVMYLNKLSGVYIYSCDKTLQEMLLVFSYESSVFKIKFNDGVEVPITETNAHFLSVYDLKGFSCKLYLIPRMFEKYTVEQLFIYKNLSDSLPVNYYDDKYIPNLFTAIGDQFTTTSESYSFNSITPHDNGYRLCNIQNMTMEYGGGRPKVIFSGGNSYWIAINNFLIRFTDGFGSLVATFSNTHYIIKAFPEFITGDELWVVLAPINLDDYYILAHLNITTEDVTEYETNKLPISTLDNQTVYSNFFATSNSIFYARGNQEMWRMDFIDNQFRRQGNLTLSGANNIDESSFCFSCNNGSFVIVDVSGSIHLFNVNGSGTLITTPLTSVTNNAIVIDSGGTTYLYYTDTNANINLYTITSSGTVGTNSLPFGTDLKAYGFYKVSNSIYFYGNATKYNSQYYTIGIINISNLAAPTISTTQDKNIKIPNIDFEIKQTGLTLLDGVYYLLTPTGRLFQYHTSNSLYTNGTVNLLGKNVRSLLNELCSIYGLIYLCKPNKTLLVFPRTNSSGDVLYQGANYLPINESNIININKKLGEFGKATKIKAESDGYSADYNGTNFDTVDTEIEKIISLNNNILQHSTGMTLQDISKFYYPFFSKTLNVLELTFATPNYEYEVTDGAEINLSGTKINIYGSQVSEWEDVVEDWEDLQIVYNTDLSYGLIQKQNINSDGTMEVEVLI